MLSETLKIVKGLAPAADRFNTGPSTDIFNLALAERLTFLVYHAGGTTGKATLTVDACSDVSATGAEAVAYRYRRMTTGASDVVGAISNATASGIDTVAGEDTIIEIEVLADELPAGKPFARLTLTEAANDPVNAAVIGILSGLKYGGVNAPSVLS